MNTPRADDWRSRGGHFSWQSAEESASSVEIFHVEIGDPSAPVLLLIHGWPTSSIDWFEVANQLSARFRVCALDFPGYGFSSKPQGWGYSLTRDAELIEYYVSEVIGAEAGVVVAHDRGDSVALIHAARCADGRSAMRLEHLVLSNANIFLPMAKEHPPRGPAPSRRHQNISRSGIACPWGLSRYLPGLMAKPHARSRQAFTTRQRAAGTDAGQGRQARPGRTP